MKNTIHTPGPWENMGFYISARNQELPLPNAQTIARVFPEHETVGGNTLANARLISASPDMFQALQTIVSDYEALMRSQGAQVNIGSDFTAAEWVGSRLGGHIAKAKNIVSKARGEV
jgi:hypothetical protein